MDNNRKSNINNLEIKKNLLEIFLDQNYSEKGLNPDSQIIGNSLILENILSDNIYAEDEPDNNNPEKFFSCFENSVNNTVPYIQPNSNNLSTSLFENHNYEPDISDGTLQYEYKSKKYNNNFFEKLGFTIKLIFNL